jgi:hypothetical protein
MNNITKSMIDFISINKPISLDEPVSIFNKGYFNEEGYFCSEEYLNEEYKVPGPNFLYKINKNNFRSIHFKTLDTNSINILVGGCSNTVGNGLPEEYMWSNLLKNKIQNLYPNKKVELYNVSVHGGSSQIIFKNIISFIKNYGTPDYVFMLIPEVARGLHFSNELNSYIKVIPNINIFDNKIKQDVLEYARTYKFENQFLSICEMLNALEYIFNVLNIKAGWTTWKQNELYMYKDLNYKYFINFKIDQDPYYKINNDGSQWIDPDYPINKNNLPYWNIARDGAHGGTCWNIQIANIFGDFIE